MEKRVIILEEATIRQRKEIKKGTEKRVVILKETTKK